MNDNNAVSSEPSQIGQWATRQLADYDDRQPGTMFSEGVMLSVPQAYEVQSAVSRLRCDRGERVIGYKVGCTSPRIREQLGIDHCITGRLYNTEQHSSGAVLSRRKFVSLAIEGELAVELSREPDIQDFREDGIPSCIRRIFPVIELHNHVIRGQQHTAGELIANNAIHAGFVEGTGINSSALSGEQSFDTAELSIFADGRLLDQCLGPALVQTINSSLKWLTTVVRETGIVRGTAERLRAGQIILTGSIPALIPIAENCCLRVDAKPFGTVEAKLVP